MRLLSSVALARCIGSGGCAEVLNSTIPPTRSGARKATRGATNPPHEVPNMTTGRADADPIEHRNHRLGAFIHREATAGTSTLPMARRVER